LYDVGEGHSERVRIGLARGGAPFCGLAAALPPL
jgi:hypothetical protein